MAAFWVVDYHTRCLLCWCFTALRQQKETTYCMEPELTAEEAFNLSCLKQLAACTGTCLVPLGDRTLLRPHTGDCPWGHLLDLAVVCILALCHHFPS